MSSLSGCLLPPQGKFKFYEGDEQPTRELALIDYCARLFRHFPHKHELMIDGKDVHLAARPHTYSLFIVPCRAWIVAGEHQVYFYAEGSGSRDLKGERKGRPSSFEGIVNFKAGKTYYFIYNSTGGWPFPIASGAWIEDDEGNVVAGEKVKAFGRQ